MQLNYVKRAEYEPYFMWQQKEDKQPLRNTPTILQSVEKSPKLV